MTSLECRKAVVGETATNAEELRRMRAAVWHKMGLAVIDPEKIANDFERQREGEPVDG